MDSNPESPNLHWELLDSREDRRYGLFSVRINRNRSPRTGKIHQFQVLTSPDWVAVVPVTPDNNVIMVRQYRHGTANLSLEPPGGLAKQGQTPEESAREELEEETGYLAEKWELIGRMDAMPALFTNSLYVFMATNATPTGTLSPDETEDLETLVVPVEDVKRYIREGKITSSVMIAALYLFLDCWEG
jgi:ADP-ribose pyrophosphatase